MSSRFAFFLYVIAFAFLIQRAFGVDPALYLCSNTGNFSANDPYESNLNNLTSYLSTQAPPSGFGLGSVGQKQNQAYGLALCRGDVKTSDCKDCIVEAGSEIRKRCPYNKGAIIWYETCLLKYSDKKFFGQIDVQPVIYMYNLTVVKDPEPFNRKTKDLLSQLANKAYATPKLYAAGEMKLYNGSDPKLYGLTQCTRDISNTDCKKCFDSIIGILPDCCNGTIGGRVVGASCNFRYELYRFYNP